MVRRAHLELRPKRSTIPRLGSQNQHRLMSKKRTYRITFHNQGKVYEVYARNVHDSRLLGFVEVEDFVFGEKSSIVVDPSEENLKLEFSGVRRTHIPMHAVIRIDEVEKTGHAKITEVTSSSGNVAPFPTIPSTKDKPKT